MLVRKYGNGVPTLPLRRGVGEREGSPHPTLSDSDERSDRLSPGTTGPTRSQDSFGTLGLGSPPQNSIRKGRRGVVSLRRTQTPPRNTLVYKRQGRYLRPLEITIIITKSGERTGPHSLKKTEKEVVGTKKRDSHCLERSTSWGLTKSTCESPLPYIRHSHDVYGEPRLRGSFRYDSVIDLELETVKYVKID